MKINLSKFKEIPGFSKYLISEDGIIYSNVRNQIISVSKNWAGYLTATLTDDNSFRSPRKVHRLVYLAWVGPIPKEKVIDHIDNNKLNNHYTNLQLLTPSENSIKSFTNGKNKDKVVWTDDQIISICEQMEDNVKSYDIFLNIGIDWYMNRNQCNMLLGQLKRGEIHQNIASKYNIKNYIGGINRKDNKLSIAQVENIYMQILLGESMKKLSKEYDVSHSTIRKIKLKITWKNLTDKIDEEYFQIKDKSSTTIEIL